MEAKKRQRVAQNAVGQEMKDWEAATCDAMVDLSRTCVVRLDGHCFHTFTKGFRRPYDLRIHTAMVGTATDLVERFGAVTAYTESDEISLLFPASTPEVLNVPFNGRVQKICSVMAGFASARFNLHMCAQEFDKCDPNEVALAERVSRSEAHFDSRVFTLPDTRKLVEYMCWRALMDCRRNSISMLAQAHFSPQTLHGVDAKTCLRMLREEKDVDWEAEPAFFRFGVYIKKEQYEKPAINKKTLQEVVAIRTRAASRSFELNPEDAASFLLEKYWPGPGPGPGMQL